MTLLALPVRVWLASFAVCAAATIVRFLSQVGLPNDHYLYLAPAQQMLHGEWPSWDFTDPGTPAMYVASAIAQLTIGAPLVAETWLVSLAFGLAAALTLVAAYRVSGSVVVGLVAAVVEVALFPRSYHYPKLIVHAAGVLALFAYAEMPTRRRAAVVAGCIVIGLLFRHDHGVYLAIGAAMAALLARPGWRTMARHVGEVVGFSLAFALPYLVYLQASTGLVAHVRSGLAYSDAEAERTALGFPTIDVGLLLTDDGLRVCLFYAFHALPLLAAAIALRRASTAMPGAGRPELARILPLAVLAAALNVSMLRDPLQARLPDVAVPACVLAAWLVPVAWRARRGRAVARAALVASVVAGLAMVNVVGAPMEQLDRANLQPTPTWRQLVALVREHHIALGVPLAEDNFSSGAMESLIPLFEYMQRCTASDDRLFIAGDLPEVFVQAGRRFAGGQPALRRGFFDTPADQQRLVSRLRGQQVPLALIITDGDVSEFPIVMAELEERFERLATIPLRGHTDMVLLGNREIPVRGTDRAMGGLPCYR